MRPGRPTPPEYNCILQCGPPRRADATAKAILAQHTAAPSMRSAPEGGCDGARCQPGRQNAYPSMRSAPEGGCDPIGRASR